MVSPSHDNPQEVDSLFIGRIIFGSRSIGLPRGRYDNGIFIIPGFFKCPLHDLLGSRAKEKRQVPYRTESIRTGLDDVKSESLGSSPATCDDYAGIPRYIPCGAS